MKFGGTSVADAERLKRVLTALGRDNGHLVIAGAGGAFVCAVAAAVLSRAWGDERAVVAESPQVRADPDPEPS